MKRPLRDSVNPGVEVLLASPHLATPQEIDAHRVKLQGLGREGIAVWISLGAVTHQTRFWLNFVERTFHSTEGSTVIQETLRSWLSPGPAFERVYLLAQANAETPCYDITTHVQRGLDGDFSVADRLKGRTIFRLYQTETQAADVLSREGVGEIVGRILKRYLHEFADFLGGPVIGFCCELPPFLSPLRTPSLAIPWSVELIDTLKSIPGVAVLSHLPLIYYETYDSATVRSRFWEQLTRQFAKVCVEGLRAFCHQWELQFAVALPATLKTLEIDTGAVLSAADRSILSVETSHPSVQLLIGRAMTGQSRSGQISICRSHSNAHIGPGQQASEGVLGFNSWMFDERGDTKPRRHADAHHGVAEQYNNLNRFLSMGVPRRSVLILSPIHSLWTKPDADTWHWIVGEWRWLCQTVWELGYDFDIASETALATATIDKDSRALRLQEAAYRLILLPVCLSLQEETVEMLVQFVKARGKLIAVAPVPYLLNGRIGMAPYPLERLLYQWRVSIARGTASAKANRLARLLRKAIKRPIQIYVKPDNAPADAIAVQHRQLEALDLFYLFNRDCSPVETLIEIRWEATVEEWDTASGEQLPFQHWHADGNTYANLRFEPLQGRLVVARRSNGSAQYHKGVHQ